MGHNNERVQSYFPCPQYISNSCKKYRNIGKKNNEIFDFIFIWSFDFISMLEYTLNGKISITAKPIWTHENCTKTHKRASISKIKYRYKTTVWNDVNLLCGRSKTYQKIIILICSEPWTSNNNAIPEDSRARHALIKHRNVQRGSVRTISSYALGRWKIIVLHYLQGIITKITIIMITNK